jgi:hypothetical protein
MAGGTPNVKHLWIADSTGIGDPAKVSESTPEYPGSVGKVGNLKEAAGLRTKNLQYVKRVSTDTTVAAAAGAVAYWQDQDDFVVCADQTLAIGGATAPLPAGVFLGTLPSAGSFGYIQVSGTANLLQAGLVATDIAAGDPLFAAGGDSDGLVTGPAISVAVGTDATTNAAELLVRRRTQVAIALEAKTDSTVSIAALLQFPHNGW